MNVKFLGAGLMAGMLTAATAQAVILAEYDASRDSSPLSPTTQGWNASQIIEADDDHELATVTDTSGDPELANAGPGSIGWIIRDYLDGAEDGQDDRPEYNLGIGPGGFANMANGWKFTVTFKMDSDALNNKGNQEMRLLSLDQGGGEYLPFDLKVNVRHETDDTTSNLVVRLPVEDGDGTGTFTSFDTGVSGADFNTIVMEDVDGDGTFSMAVNGNPIMNTVDNTFLFDSTPSNNDVPGDDVIVFGANSTGGDGGGVEYALVRLEAVPEPSALVLSSLAVLAGLGIRRRA